MYNAAKLCHYIPRGSEKPDSSLRISRSQLLIPPLFVHLTDAHHMVIFTRYLLGCHANKAPHFDMPNHRRQIFWHRNLSTAPLERIADFVVTIFFLIKENRTFNAICHTKLADNLFKSSAACRFHKSHASLSERWKNNLLAQRMILSINARPRI